MAKQADNYGTFEKDGKTKVAYDQAQAVRLRFDGWAEKKAPTVDVVKANEQATTTNR